jgi:hypothetical protein
VPLESRKKESQAKMILDRIEVIEEKKEENEEGNLEKYISGAIQEEIREEEIILEAKLVGTKDGLVDDILEELKNAKPMKLNINDKYDAPFFGRTKEVLKYVAKIIVKPKVDGFESQMGVFERTAGILIEEKYENGVLEGVNVGYEDTIIMENLGNQVDEILVSEKEDETVEKGIEQGEEEIEEKVRKIMKEEGCSNDEIMKMIKKPGLKMYKSERELRKFLKAQLEKKITAIYGAQK